MAGARMTIMSASGAEVCATTAAADGEYACTLDSSAQGPFVVIADDGAQKQYSTASLAQDSTANVTPLTTLVVARLSPTGDPNEFAAQVAANPAVASEASVNARVSEVAAIVAPLAAAVGGGTLNPLTGRFAADGTGHDKVLDALQVTIRPEGRVSNIEVTVKVTPAADDAPPVAVNFRSSDASVQAPTVTVRPQDLPDDGVATRVRGFLDRMTACYALPLAQRISDVAPGATTATGAATSVQAPECKALFFNDDPTIYFNNGLRVGSSGDFTGMFREVSTGAAFDRGTFEYQLANGDVYMSFRSLTTSASVGHSVLTLRQQDGKLKAIGNQYIYDASVRPYTIRRDFPLQSQYSYDATGYSVGIANRVDAGGNMVFKEAIVTTPTGRQLLYRPQAGRSFMTIVRDSGVLSGTGVEFFAASFIDPRTLGNPADVESAPVYATNQLTDEQLRSIPNHGVWKVEFVHADSAMPNLTQVYRTIERASTIGEARQASYARFSEPLLASWLSRSDVQAFAGITFPAPSAVTPTVVKIEADGGGDGWTLPEGAVLPTNVSLFGRSLSNQRFNDGLNVATIDRKATIRCVLQSVGDDHCDTSTGVNQFAQGGRIWTIELWGRNIRQVERAAGVAFWRLPN